MALTDHCDVFGAVHEDGFNRIFRHIQRQRPSLFNYATRAFATRPELMCREIEAHAEVARRNNPLVTIEDPLPIPNTDGRFGMDFCAQLTKVALDLHPASEFDLPPELAPLGSQTTALAAQFCVGLSCPDRERAEAIGDLLAEERDRAGGDADGRDRPDDTPRPPPVPIPSDTIICFCLEVFATLRIARLRTQEGEVLVPRLADFEIVDIRPEPLETALECYVETILRVGILPRLRFAVDTFIEDMGSFLGLTPALVPVSGDVPNNPAIEDDQLKVFVDLGF